jgi:hypothetical protein
MMLSFLEIASTPDPRAISTAIGTVLAAVAALVAIIFNWRTLLEMRTERELSIRPYLLFSHDSFRRQAAKLWQQLEQDGVPINQRGRRVIEQLLRPHLQTPQQLKAVPGAGQRYTVQARNVGNGPAIGCYFYAYFPHFRPNGQVSTSYFLSGWFSLGASTGPNDDWSGVAFQSKGSWDTETEKNLQQELGNDWEEKVRGSSSTTREATRVKS